MASPTICPLLLIPLREVKLAPGASSVWYIIPAAAPRGPSDIHTSTSRAARRTWGQITLVMGLPPPVSRKGEFRPRSPAAATTAGLRRPELIAGCYGAGSEK